MPPKGKTDANAKARPRSPSGHTVIEALKTTLQPKLQKGVLAAFREWDAGGKGHISLPDLKAVLTEVGVPEGHVPKLFSLADANKDSKIDYEEFVAWLFAVAPTAVPPDDFRRVEREIARRDRTVSPPPERRPAAERGGHPDMWSMRPRRGEREILVTCKLAAPVCPLLDFTIKVTPSTRISELADRIVENHGGSIKDPKLCVHRFHPEEIVSYESTLQDCGVTEDECCVYYDYVALGGAVLAT